MKVKKVLATVLAGAALLGLVAESPAKPSDSDPLQKAEPVKDQPLVNQDATQSKPGDVQDSQAGIAGQTGAAKDPQIAPGQVQSLKTDQPRTH